MPGKVDMITPMENGTSSDAKIQEDNIQDIDLKLNSIKSEEIDTPEIDDIESLSLRLSDEEDEQNSLNKSADSETLESVNNDDNVKTSDKNERAGDKKVDTDKNIKENKKMDTNDVSVTKKGEEMESNDEKMETVDKNAKTNGKVIKENGNANEKIVENDSKAEKTVDNEESNKSLDKVNLTTGTTEKDSKGTENENSIEKKESTEMLIDDSTKSSCNETENHDESSSSSNLENINIKTNAKDKIPLETKSSKNEQLKTGGKGKRSIDEEGNEEASKKRKFNADDSNLKENEPTAVKMEVDENKDSKKETKLKDVKEIKEDEVTVTFNKKTLTTLMPVLLNNNSITSMDLEELILTKICEALTSRMDIALLREKVQSQEVLNEQYRKRYSSLSKQFDDINIVFNRLSADLKAKTIHHPTPIKITRSVGLQVVMPSAMTVVRRDGPNQVSNNENNPITPKVEQSKLTKIITPTRSTPNNKPTSTPINKPSNSPNKPANTPINKPSTTPTNKIVNTATPKIATPNTKVINNSTPTSGISNKISIANKVNQKVVNQPVKKNTAFEKAKANDDKPIIDLTDEDPPTNNTATTTTSSRNSSPSVVSTSLRLLPNSNPATLLMTPGNQPILIRADNSIPNGYINGTPANIVLQNNSGMVAKRVPMTRTPRPVMANTRRLVPIIPTVQHTGLTHPAPLPIFHNSIGHGKTVPPKPLLKLTKAKDGGGIQLSWTMPTWDAQLHEEISSYQLYAYQETSAPPNSDIWKKIGDIKALPLPMACTLTSFQRGYKYYFAVCAIDIQDRFGMFSSAQPISLIN